MRPVASVKGWAFGNRRPWRRGLGRGPKPGPNRVPCTRSARRPPVGTPGRAYDYNGRTWRQLRHPRAWHAESMPGVRSSRDLEAGWQPRSAQVDAVSEHRNAFLNQELALSPSHRHAPVCANHAMPWEAFVSGGKNVTDQAGRSRVDVAIRADESNRNRAHPAHDARCARIEAVALRRHGVTLGSSPPSAPRRTPRRVSAGARAPARSPSATRRARTRRAPPRTGRASLGGRRARPAVGGTT